MPVIQLQVSSDPGPPIVPESRRNLYNEKMGTPLSPPTCGARKMFELSIGSEYAHVYHIGKTHMHFASRNWQ